jgi:regulator of protease activity HflC (stomatin/prohibitin superfamily)
VRIPPPTVEQGVSNADIAAYGARCYDAGRAAQRRRTSGMTRAEVEAQAEVYRAEGRAQAVGKIAESAISAIMEAVDREIDAEHWALRRLADLRDHPLGEL